jgi:hypothetical protein
MKIKLTAVEVFLLLILLTQKVYNKNEEFHKAFQSEVCFLSENTSTKFCVS